MTENVFKKIVGVESVDGMWIAAEVDLPWQTTTFNGTCLRRLLVLENVQVCLVSFHELETRSTIELLNSVPIFALFCLISIGASSARLS